MIRSSLSSLGKLVAVDNVFSDITGTENSHSNNVHTTVTTLFEFDLFYKWDRFPLVGGMVRVWSMAKRWHRAGGLGRGQDLVLSFSDTELYATY